MTSTQIRLPMQFSMIMLDRMAWHGMEQHGMAWHSMAWHGIAWHGMEQHGMAWNSMAWHGMEQHGMAWNSMQKKDDNSPPDKNQSVLKLDFEFHYNKKIGKLN